MFFYVESTKLCLTLLFLVLYDFSKGMKFYAAVNNIVTAQNASRKTDLPKKTIVRSSFLLANKEHAYLELK